MSNTNTIPVLKSSNNLETKKAKKSYKLRDASVKKREEVETRKNTPRKRGPKPRPKTAPMSKYRRRTANLRERLRMGEINVAFEKLRDKLPNPMAQAGKTKCEKLTKINILHVAINYIRAMENLLETGDSGVQSFSEMTKNPLRDESDRKIEMQRILATLMARADKVHHQARSKKSARNKDKDFLEDSSSSDENMEDDTIEDDIEEDEEEEDEEEEGTTWSSSAVTTSADADPPSSNAGPILSPDTSWTESSGSSTSLTSPSLCFAKPPNLQGPHHNNNNEDIMKDFTDFVDLVDSLHGMPDIDFEDNFEMFPC